MMYPVGAVCVNCKNCNKKLLTRYEQKGYWYEGALFPEDHYYAYCPECGEEWEISPWEYSILKKEMKEE